MDSETIGAVRLHPKPQAHLRKDVQRRCDRPSCCCAMYRCGRVRMPWMTVAQSSAAARPCCDPGLTLPHTVLHALSHEVSQEPVRAMPPILLWVFRLVGASAHLGLVLAALQGPELGHFVSQDLQAVSHPVAVARTLGLSLVAMELHTV